MSTYQPTACLSASYEQEFAGQAVNTFVPARAVHQGLFDDEALYRRLYATHGLTQTVINQIDSCNIAVGEMTLLYSEVPVGEGLPGRLRQFKLPVKHFYDLEHVSFSAADLYGEDVYVEPGVRAGTRSHSFNDQLQRHYDLARLIFPVAQLPRAERTALKQNIALAIRQGDFQQVFHHSEQGMMYSFGMELNIAEIVTQLGNHDAAVFGGVVLDFFTTRLKCNNCAYHLLGFADRMMQVILQALRANQELEIAFPNNDAVLFHPRVSAREFCKTNNGATIYAAADRTTHQYRHHQRKIPLQTTATQMRLTEHLWDRFKTNGDFFLSGKIREDNIDAVVIDNRNNGLRP